MTRRGRAAALVVVLSLASSRAFAQSPDELKAARELFQEAFKDEQDHRYAEALDKFQRVAKVKESASVRYRIATVLTELGRLREARDMYRALAASKPTLPANDRQTADSAAEKAAELDKRIPRLALRLEDPPPADARVMVDGAPVPVSTTPRAIELDPGEHVVAATARGGVRSEHKVTLVDGAGEVPHTVTFQAEDERRLMAETISKSPAPETHPPVVPGKRNTTLAWVAIGGGGVLVLTGTALLIARESTIGDIESTCPNNVCPTLRRAEIEDNRDRAALFGPLGGVLTGVGLATVGAGVYLLVRPLPAAQATAAFLPGPGGFRLRMTF